MARRRSRTHRGEKWTYWEIREVSSDGSFEVKADPDDPETTDFASHASADAVLTRLIEDDYVDPKRTHVYEITVKQVGC